MLKTERLNIRDKIEGPIADVITQLQALALEHPEARIDIDVFENYGTPTCEITLEWQREMTALERQQNTLEYKRKCLTKKRADAAICERIGTPYPKAGEITALVHQLGITFSDPKLMRWPIHIHKGELVLAARSENGRSLSGPMLRQDGTQASI